MVEVDPEARQTQLRSRQLGRGDEAPFSAALDSVYAVPGEAHDDRPARVRGDVRDAQGLLRKQAPNALVVRDVPGDFQSRANAR